MFVPDGCELGANLNPVMTGAIGAEFVWSKQFTEGRHTGGGVGVRRIQTQTIQLRVAAAVLVWRGEHRATGCAVAVSFVPFKVGAKDSDIYRFRAEVRSIARIVHPGVVRIYDEGILQRQSEPASRYHEDLSVLEVVTVYRHGMGSRWELGHNSHARRLGHSSQQSCTHYLRPSAHHTHGVIHRDVKPQNILISGDRILLTDFGVAFERDAPGTDANRSHGKLTQTIWRPSKC